MKHLTIHILLPLLLLAWFQTATAYEIDTLVCENMSINSPQDDYTPYLFGNSMMFTSNRKSTQEGSSLDYTEKVYFSIMKEDENGERQWTKPEKNGYKWNSDNNTALVGANESNYFFYRAYWLNNGEIYAASRIEDETKPWKASKMKKVKAVCTDTYDECSIVDINGTLYFVSNRSGNYDIYKQNGENAEAVDILNSEADENDLFFAENILFFASNRDGGIGGYDIYFSVFDNDEFSEPKLLDDTIVNTTANDRDYRWYADTLAFFASDRDGGKGGLDIYEFKLTKIEYPDPDTIPLAQIEPIEQADPFLKVLEENGLTPFRGEVQLGAFRYITSIEQFKKQFPCVKNENIRMDLIEVDSIKVYKFIIDTVYSDVETALQKRDDIVSRKCLPDELLSDKPFVGMLDKDGNRFAFFREKKEFETDQIYYLYKNGQLIWYGRRF